MTRGTLGSYSGKTVPGINMLEVFAENEIGKHPNSILKFSRMTIRKFAIACPAGTRVTMNDSEITLFSGVFEVGDGTLDITNLVFDSEIEINCYYIY